MTVASDEGLQDGAVCLSISGSDGELGCSEASIPAGENRTVSVSIGNWAENHTGTQTLEVDVRAVNESGSLATRSISMTVLFRDGDIDGDGLSNERESSLGISLRSNDTDADGLSDAVEVDTYETSPNESDTDGDGLSDYVEVERYQTDPTKVDTDEDGLPDPRELELGTNPNKADTDGDGVDDGLEVNTYGTNSTAPDSDGDGLDDGTEVNEYETNPLEPDTDGDGLSDNLEVNTYDTDPNQIDTDGDGLEDGPEVNTYGTNPTNVDTDGDGLEDGAEVNEYETDPNAADSDGDGVSDPEAVAETSDDRMPLFLAGLTGIVVAAVAIAGFLAWTGRAPLAQARTALLGTSSARESDSEATRTSGEADRAEDSAIDDTTAPTPSGAQTDAATDDDPVPRELLSDEELVFALLDDHDGRVRQADIVDETEWSKSKVSRALSAMEDDGAIIKIDVGRGNIVMRPEDVPPGAGSALED